MAAISGILPVGRGFRTIREATAQANVGQTDWLAIPEWARSALFWFNLKAVAGTTPVATPTLLATDPIELDTNFNQVWYQGAAITVATQHVYDIRRTGSGADGVDAAAADAWIWINKRLPPILGAQLVLDRGTGDETYTYRMGIQLYGADDE